LKIFPPTCFRTAAAAATGGSGGFPTAERAREEDRFNNFEMSNGRLETAPPSAARIFAECMMRRNISLPKMPSAFVSPK
jgi:hypothetical protein